MSSARQATSSVIRVRVAAFACVDGKVLLAEHVKGDRVYYMLPGGGVQHGETLVAALARELEEEADVAIEGLRLQALCESISPGGARHIIHVVFRCEHVSGAPRATGRDPRVRAVRWVPIDEFFSLPFYPDIKDYLLEAAEGPVGPLYRELRWIR